MRWVVYFVVANGVLVMLALGALALTGSFDGQGLSTDGWVALVFGIFLTSALGIGLMALVFYSDRADIDDEAYRTRGTEENAVSAASRRIDRSIRT